MRSGNIELSRMLIEKKDADVNLCGRKYQRLPLHFAIYNNDEDMIKLLIDNNAEPYQDLLDDLDNPLVCAIKCSTVRICRLLINRSHLSADDIENLTELADGLGRYGLIEDIYI